MISAARTRLLAIVVLLGLQAVLFPLYAVQPVNDAAGVLPDENEFLVSPDEYLGERVVSGGIVQQTDPIVIQVQARSGTQEVTIHETDISPAIGDKVRVTGILSNARTIRAQTAFVVPPSGRWYAWGISFLAGLWVLCRLIRHWRVDRTTLAFEPRAAPLSARTILRWIQPGGGNDA